MHFLAGMAEPVSGVGPCVVCGGRNADVVADHGEIEEELETLWAYHTQRLRPETPPTQLVDRAAFSEEPPWRVVRCRSCGLVYRSPAEGAAEVSDAYRRAQLPDGALASLHEAQLGTARSQAQRIRAAVGAHTNGLEVGSYTGAFLRAARDEGIDFQGLDVSPAANAFARSMGLAAEDGDFSAYVAPRAFGVVAIWNTFDQLADPGAAARRAWRMLRPNGLLALRVPNGGVYARLRRSMSSGGAFRRAFARAMLIQNNLLTFPYRFGFPPASLCRLVRAAGFRVERIVGDTLPVLGDAWTRPWARVEERIVKGFARWAARRDPDVAPWFELYARRVG